MLYKGFSTHGYFGFIAHYDIHGYYDARISTPQQRTVPPRVAGHDTDRLTPITLAPESAPTMRLRARNRHLVGAASGAITLTRSPNPSMRSSKLWFPVG
jgi:hypothetical protein